MVGSLAGMMAGGLLLLSLQLPFFYRFGPEKARLLIVVTIFLVAALFGASLSVENTSGLSLLFSLLNPTPMASFLLIAAAFFLVVGSFFLCVRIYCKREE